MHAHMGAAGFYMRKLEFEFELSFQAWKAFLRERGGARDPAQQLSFVPRSRTSTPKAQRQALARQQVDPVRERFERHGLRAGERELGRDARSGVRRERAWDGDGRLREHGRGCARRILGQGATVERAQAQAEVSLWLFAGVEDAGRRAA